MVSKNWCSLIMYGWINVMTANDTVEFSRGRPISVHDPTISRQGSASLVLRNYNLSHSRRPSSRYYRSSLSTLSFYLLSFVSVQDGRLKRKTPRPTPYATLTQHSTQPSGSSPLQQTLLSMTITPFPSPRPSATTSLPIMVQCPTPNSLL